MGNAAPPRMCREAAGTTTAAGPGGKRRSNKAAAAAAAPRRVAAVKSPRKQRDGDDDVEEAAMRAGPWRRRGGALRAGGGEAGAGVVGSRDAAAVTVKIVMRRKDAEALVARLNEQSAPERKARMAELKSELCTADGGGASPASCRDDAWRPRLAPIQEN